MGADPTSGMGPLLPIPPVMIAGVGYRIRRLGILDLFTVLELARELLTQGHIQLGVRLRGLPLSAATTQIAMALAGLPECREKVMAFLADLIGIPPDALANPALFPLGSEIKLLSALAQHPDVTAFLAAARAEGTALSDLWRQMTSPEPSTESRPDTDGPTSTA